jgi:hypothetical protein
MRSATAWLSKMDVRLSYLANLPSWSTIFRVSRSNNLSSSYCLTVIFFPERADLRLLQFKLSAGSIQASYQSDELLFTITLDFISVIEFSIRQSKLKFAWI